MHARIASDYLETWSSWSWEVGAGNLSLGSWGWELGAELLELGACHWAPGAGNLELLSCPRMFRLLWSCVGSVCWAGSLSHLLLVALLPPI